MEEMPYTEYEIGKRIFRVTDPELVFRDEDGQIFCRVECAIESYLAKPGEVSEPSSSPNPPPPLDGDPGKGKTR